MHYANLEAIFTLNRIACLFTHIEHRAFVFGRELGFGSVNSRENEVPHSLLVNPNLNP